MTEADWLACDEPPAMLDFLAGRISRRQMLLFACACARGWDNPMARRAVALGERLADGRADLSDWRAAVPPLPAFLLNHLPLSHGPDLLLQMINPQRIASFVAHIAVLRGEGPAGARHADFLRDVVGSPFHAPALSDAARRFQGGLIARLAEPIYDEQLYDRLPVLGDALEEAGADTALVEHCHSDGPHVRGCWAIDLILGRASGAGGPSAADRPARDLR